MKKFPPAGSQASAGGYLRYGVTSILNEWRSSLNPGIPLPFMTPFNSPPGTITLRSCKIPTPQTHLCKQLLQTTTHFQIDIPAMEYNLSTYIPDSTRFFSLFSYQMPSIAGFGNIGRFSKPPSFLGMPVSERFLLFNSIQRGKDRKMVGPCAYSPTPDYRYRKRCGFG